MSALVNADDNKVVEITSGQTGAQIASATIGGLTNCYVLVFNRTSNV
jgi:hypothetical protein